MERQQWKSRADFLYTTIGYCVGLGNIWRFPYLCAESGAGAFLVPYLFMTLVLGVPLFYLEVGIGQSFKKGPADAFSKLYPGLYGVGMATVMLTFLLASYYCVVMAWSLFIVYDNLKNSIFTNVNSTSFFANQTDTRFYWETTVLQNSRLEIFFCLLTVWIAVFFTIRKGVSTAAKIAKWTILLPYCLLIVLLIKTINIPGAKKGILYFITPQWKEMFTFKVWINAAAQIFNSLAVFFGGLVTYGSYRTEQNGDSLLKDSAITVLMNSFTSIVSGLLIFSAIGVIAETKGETIDENINEGIDLLFVVYPVLFQIIGNEQLWSIIFFTIVLFLGFNTEFTMVQTVQTFVEDVFKIENRKRGLVTLTICLVMFTASLPTVSSWGIKYYKLMDSYTCIVGLMIVAFLEVGIICWGYGIDNLEKLFLSNKVIEGKMTTIVKIALKFICPTLIFIILCITFGNISVVKYKDEPYSTLAHAYGFFISSLSVLCIPAGMILIKRKFDLKNWSDLWKFQPTEVNKNFIQ